MSMKQDGPLPRQDGAAMSPSDAAIIERTREDAVLACGTCNACCYSPVALRPERGDNPEAYQLALSHDTSAPNGLTMLTLDRNPDGSCYALKDGRCSIWPKRPAVCRNFDCRRLFWMYDKAQRRELIAKGYFKRTVFDAGRMRGATLEDGPGLREVCRRVNFGARSITFMERWRGVKP